MQRGGTGLCKEPTRSLSSGRLPTSISLEEERQRSVIAKSRSCKIAAALVSPFFPAWCIFLVPLHEQDLLPVSGTSFAGDVNRGTLADATDDIPIAAGWCSFNALRPIFLDVTPMRITCPLWRQRFCDSRFDQWRHDCITGWRWMHAVCRTLPVLRHPINICSDCTSVRHIIGKECSIF